MLPDRSPESLIMLYQDELFAGVVGFQATTPLGGHGIYGRAVTLDHTNGRVAVIGGFGIGAPVAAIVLEELIAIGVTRFLSIGTAGGLQPDLAPGDVVLCTSAVRDEGVSHHYVPHEAPAEPDAALTDALEQSIRAAGLPYRRGSSWTIDTPYRETADAIFLVPNNVDVHAVLKEIQDHVLPLIHQAATGPVTIEIPRYQPLPLIPISEPGGSGQSIVVAPRPALDGGVFALHPIHPGEDLPPAPPAFKVTSLSGEDCSSVPVWPTGKVPVFRPESPSPATFPAGSRLSSVSDPATV